MGTLEQGLLDLVSPGLQSWKVVQVRLLLCDLLPQCLNRVGGRRRGRQLDDRSPCGLLGEKGLGLGAGVIPRPIVHEAEGAGGVLPDPLKKETGRGGVEVALLPLVKALPRTVIHPAADCRAGALAGGLALRWLATPRPRVPQGAPRRHRGCIAPPPQGPALLRETSYLGPCGGTPRVALRCREMSRDQGRLLRAAASVCEQRGAREDIRVAAATVGNQLREHG
jgi:hypothetical protein